MYKYCLLLSVAWMDGLLAKLDHIHITNCAVFYSCSLVHVTTSQCTELKLLTAYLKPYASNCLEPESSVGKYS